MTDGLHHDDEEISWTCPECYQSFCFGDSLATLEAHYQTLKADWDRHDSLAKAEFKRKVAALLL